MKSGYQESLNQFKDLVNQPRQGESLGENLTILGRQGARHPEDFQANALLSGMGAGLKERATRQRSEELSPILRQAGQITAKAAEIEAQSQIATEGRTKATQLFKQTAVPIAQLSQAALAGDIDASDKLAKGVYAQFKQSLGDTNMGDFDHFHNGVIYYENPTSGVIEGRNIIGLMYQSGVNPVEIWGPDAQMVEIGLSPGSKQNYENTARMQQLEMQNKEADIANKYSQAYQHNAMANRTINEMNNPVNPYDTQLDMEIKKDRAAKNYVALEKEIIPRLTANENILNTYEAIKDIQETNPGIVGSDYFTRIKRAFAVGAGFSPDIDYANLKSVEFEKMLKPILGAQLGEKEGERLLNKFVSLNKNPIAINKFLAEEMPKVTRNIVEDRMKVALYDQENYANLNKSIPNIDQEIINYQNLRKKQKLDSVNNSNTSNNNIDVTNTVDMMNSAGQIFQIPRDKVEQALNDQEEPLTLVK